MSVRAELPAREQPAFPRGNASRELPAPAGKEGSSPGALLPLLPPGARSRTLQKPEFCTSRGESCSERTHNWPFFSSSVFNLRLWTTLSSVSLLIASQATVGSCVWKSQHPALLLLTETVPSSMAPTQSLPRYHPKISPRTPTQCCEPTANSIPTLGLKIPFMKRAC